MNKLDQVCLLRRATPGRLLDGIAADAVAFFLGGVRIMSLGVALGTVDNK
jgi:hypothetical protein